MSHDSNKIKLVWTQQIKLKDLNNSIDQIKCPPIEIIHEGNYLIRMIQHLQVLSPYLLQFANEIGSSINRLDDKIELKVVNLQVFEAHPFDNPEQTSSQIKHFQIQYQIIPNTTLVCWIPLDQNTTYSLTTTPSVQSLDLYKRHNESFKVKQGVRGTAINTQQQPQSLSQSKIMTLQSGQILIQNEASGPNLISAQVGHGQTYRMLAISFCLTPAFPLMSKL